MGPLGDITKLYKTQISITEWFENIKHSFTEKLRAEDNDKRERLRALNELIGLPFDKPYQFRAQEIVEQAPAFLSFLTEHGDELCALRLIPLDSSLPKLRMRGHTIKDSLNWFKEQSINVARYKADFVPHPETPLWSSIFIVNEKGIFGEVIRGGHYQLTQGFHDAEKPVSFFFDGSCIELSTPDPEARDYISSIIEYIHIESSEKKALLKENLGAQFMKDYLIGYFETATSKEFGTWFIDYNTTIAALYSDFKPIIHSSPSELSGQIASSGIVKGKVRILSQENIGTTILTENDILVCSMTTPDYFIHMQRASGVITEGGGMLSHAAIVARELAKPCIVGVGNATQLLKDGDLIELNATEGVIRRL